MVDRLYKSGWVHGDLRLCNVLFGMDGSVHLIDFEWAGQFGQATFPDNVRVNAFGEKASRVVDPSSEIPNFSDWVCLSDILFAIGSKEAAEQAAVGNIEQVEAELSSEGAWEFSHVKPNCLNLACLGVHFYTMQVVTTKEPRKREKPD